jgi:hypothetical protein
MTRKVVGATAIHRSATCNRSSVVNEKPFTGRATDKRSIHPALHQSLRLPLNYVQIEAAVGTHRGEPRGNQSAESLFHKCVELRFFYGSGSIPQPAG